MALVALRHPRSAFCESEADFAVLASLHAALFTFVAKKSVLAHSLPAALLALRAQPAVRASVAVLAGLAVTAVLADL